jgi:hypothetical protein
MIDIDGAAVAFTECADQPLMVVEKNGMVVVGENAVGLLHTPDPLVEQPLGRAGFVFGHDADGECLSLGLGLLDHTIHEGEVVLTFLRFELCPGPTEIGDGRMGILFRCRRMSEPEMKIGKAHSRVVQHLIDFTGMNSNGLPGPLRHPRPRQAAQ